MEQLLVHLVADYWLQNDWMALNKKKKFWIALVHAIIYTLPFLILTHSFPALLVICLTHAIIDHTNIVGMLNQIKNWDFYEHVMDTEFGLIHIKDGYNNRPMFIRIWLLIIQDNILHLIINFLAIKYL